MFPLHCGNDPGRDFLTSARTTAWLTRSPYEYLGNAVLIFCLMCSWSRPGFFSLYPWIYSSFQTSIIWERQGAMLVKVFSWECNLLHILCTGLSLASIMTTFHFISAHFIGCGCVLCPTVVLEDRSYIVHDTFQIIRKFLLNALRKIKIYCPCCILMPVSLCISSHWPQIN